MKLILIIFLLCVACGEQHEEAEFMGSMEHALAIQGSYITQVGRGYQLTTPGDALTFVSLAATSTCAKFLYRHEYSYDEELNLTHNTGQWNRYVEPVYENGRSRSGISFEGETGALRYLFKCGTKKAVARHKQFLEDNDYVAGAGPTKYTNVSLLRGLVSKLSKSSHTQFRGKLGGSWWTNILKSYKAAVIANYIELYGRVSGYIEDWHYDFMEEIVAANPTNPLYHAIYHKYGDGDQSEAIRILSDEDTFPFGRLPENHQERWGWGDAPSAILYIFTVDVIKE